MNITFGNSAPQFNRNFQAVSGKFKSGMRTALQQTAQEILQNGQRDIARAGNFGDKWTSGLHAPISGETINVTHDIPFFNVFLKGKVIKGNPFLWLPMAGNTIPIKNFSGQLAFVKPLSGANPIMIDTASRTPAYVGLTQVTIPKKFRLDEIIKTAANGYYNKLRAALKL